MADTTLAMSYKSSFGLIIKERRRALGLTQEELAQRVSCASITIRKIEADERRPSPEVAERLLKVLEFTENVHPSLIALARSARSSVLLPLVPQSESRPPELAAYEQFEQIGSSLLSTTYRARQRAFGREVVVRAIRPAFADCPEFVRHFEAEAQRVAMIEHPHIAPLYEYWREPGAAYLVRRWVPGGNLHQLLAESPPDLPQSLRLLEQIIAALSTAHASGVVHGALKPENLLHDGQGNIFLTDFMFGLLFDQLSQGAPSRGTVFTPQHDIYSLGSFINKLLTQEQIRTPALERVIRRAMAEQPHDRYDTVAALALDMQLAVQDVLSLPTSTIPALTVATDINPYKGLRAFQESDASDFFGREVLTRRLIERLGEEVPEARLLAVVGPSGSGKSSAVRAGLLPVLRQGGLPGSEHWFIVDMLPGDTPFDELLAALNRVALTLPPHLLNQVREHSDGLKHLLPQILPNDIESELVLVIDQFEELFTLVNDESVRQLFLESLTTALLAPQSRLRLILTLRADFYDRPLHYHAFGELVRQRIESIVALSPDELQQAIVDPAIRAGLTIERPLITAAIQEVLAQPGALPLLQYALTELVARREGQVLTLAAYQASGGVSGALISRAEAIVQHLTPAQQELTRQIFLRLVTPRDGAEDTRRRVRRDELDYASQRADLDSVLEAFGRYRLLTFDRDPISRMPTVEVAHEALIAGWPRLRGWIDANREELRVHRRLLTAAQEWVAASYDASFLASGVRLAQFEWLSSNGIALNETETAYLAASIVAREHQATEEHDRAQRELELAYHSEATQRQAARQFRLLASVLAVMLVIAIGLAGYAYSQRSQAVSSYTIAEAQRLAAEAGRLLDQNGSSETIALLSIRSLQTHYTPQGDAALVAASLLNYPKQIFRGPEVPISRVALSPDSTIAAAASEDGTAWLWHTKDARPLDRLVGHEKQVWDVVFSNDGRYLLTCGQDGSIRLWNVETKHEVRRFIGHTQSINTAILSLDGKMIVSASEDSTVRLWDAATGHVLKVLYGHDGAVYDVAFSPDGRRIVSGGADGTVRLWDVSTGREVRVLRGHEGWVSGVAFSPDGRMVLSGSYDQTARLWDVSTGILIHSFKGHIGPLFYVAYAPDGATVLTAGSDKSARVWNVATGEEVRRLSSHDEVVLGVAYSADSKTVLTGSADRTARLWDIRKQAFQITDPEGIIEALLSPDQRQVLTINYDDEIKLWNLERGTLIRRFSKFTEDPSVIFMPDGRTMAVGENDGSIRIVDLSSEHDVQRFNSQAGRVGTMDVSSDGRFLVSAGPDAIAIVWDLKRMRIVHRFVGHTQPILYVALSPDARYVATASADRTVRVWDLTSGTLIQILNGHEDWVNIVTFSPSGKFVVTASRDTTARVWDVASGKLLQTLAGHSGSILSVSILPDESLIATISEDGTARIWEQASGREVRRLSIPRGAGISVAFINDGQHFMTAHFEGLLRLWERDYQAEQRNMCALLLRDLSPIERVQYLIEDDSPTCPVS